MLKHRTATFTRVKATLQQEQFCNYIHRSCLQPRAEGSEYCIRHVLEDKAGPYRQCNYVSGKSGKRCSNAAPKAGNRDGINPSPNSYCSEHAARAAMWRQRANRRKRPVDNSGPLLEHLLHYSPELEKSLGRALPQANVISSSNQPSRVLDYDYSSESDQDPIQVDQAWRGDGDSDAESIDSEQEDPLKHAGVYTAEEVALITREKLIRLQSLYIDQFKRLQHLLKEKRRKYLTAKKMEQDILGSVIPSTDEDLDSSDKEKLRTLRATKRYRKRHGAEALLQSRSNERRIAASESHLVSKPTPPPRCNIIIDGERCSHNVVPMSRFCLQHVLHDPHQVLFQHCSHSTGGIEICDKPVAMGMDRTTCVLHSPLPPQRFKMPEKEEEMIVEEVKPDVMQIDVEEDDSKPVEVTGSEGKGQTCDLTEAATISGAEGTKEESLGNQETATVGDGTPATFNQPTTQASQQDSMDTNGET
ncbi:KAT8 regulatory NSL complex subunit 2-like isoform X1 [Branchiostoma lanceolatum]|uniref:KAT8 regulatory NSL complex subunit 2-like isoform X1 n=1 Tax=Branchiostoma lanceolatum TaxID=7740 RepID=UPI0034551CA9